MKNNYINIEEHDLNKRQKKYWSFFDDMTAYMLINKKINPILTELFIVGKKLNIFLVFIAQS